MTQTSLRWLMAGIIVLTANGMIQGGTKKHEVINLGKVNTPADENDPFLTADGKRLLFVSKKTETYNLMVSVREKLTALWQPGIHIKKYSSAEADERSPRFLSDGSLYFASNQVPDPAFKDLKNFDIFKRSGGSAPFRLRIVSTKEDEAFPWITARGSEFYFSRKTKDGWRVFVSKGPALGGPGESRLVEEIPPNYHHATLSPDALTMYLQGPVEKRSGIYRTTRSRAGAPWGKVHLITNLANHQGKRGDFSPALSPSGNYLYFASDREGGQGGLDLWMAKTDDLTVAK